MEQLAGTGELYVEGGVLRDIHGLGAEVLIPHPMLRDASPIRRPADPFDEAGGTADVDLLRCARLGKQFIRTQSLLIGLVVIVEDDVCAEGGLGDAVKKGRFRLIANAIVQGKFRPRRMQVSAMHSMGVMPMPPASRMLGACGLSGKWLRGMPITTMAPGCRVSWIATEPPRDWGSRRMPMT